MNLKNANMGGFESLIHKSKDLLLAGRMSTVSTGAVLSAARFRGRLGAAIAVITSLIVGFLTIPNNVLYFIDNKHKTRTAACLTSATHDGPDYGLAHIHAGIALIAFGCLAMVVSIVLSYFATKSKRKMDYTKGANMEPVATKSTMTVLVCLVMMNIELFMAVITGCMEVLYRPLIGNAKRMHNMECAIAVFNIIIYIMYVVTMLLTLTVLKGKHEGFPIDAQRDLRETLSVPSSARDYVSRSIDPYTSQSSYM